MVNHHMYLHCRVLALVAGIVVFGFSLPVRSESFEATFRVDARRTIAYPDGNVVPDHASSHNVSIVYVAPLLSVTRESFASPGSDDGTDINVSQYINSNDSFWSIAGGRERTDADFTPVSATTDAPRDAAARQQAMSHVHGGATVGLIHGNDGLSIRELLDLDAADDFVADDAVAGLKTRRVAKDTPYGRISAWVPESSGPPVLKYVVEKRADDRFDEVSLRERWDAEVVHWRYTYEVHDLDDVGDVPRVAEGRLEVTEASGATHITEYTYSFESFTDAPTIDESDFAIDLLPAGFPVRQAAAPGIRFIWNGERVVPAVDHDTVREIDGAIDTHKRAEARTRRDEAVANDGGQLPGQPPSVDDATRGVGRWLLPGLVVVAILSFAGVVGYYYRKRHR